jgi:signal peptidase II
MPQSPRTCGGAPFAWAVPLIVSGALGNLTDRVRHGFVVDFLQVDPDLFTYPIFNLADATIAIGVCLLLIDGVRKQDTHSDSSAHPQPARH